MSTATSQTSRLPVSRVWTVDPMHSSIGFAVTHHAVGTFRTGFDEFNGQYDPSTGALSGSARAHSVRAFPMLHDTLLSPDFFDAEKHPEIGFASSAVKADGEVLTVEGELTIKGVAKPIQATGTISETSRVRHHDGTVRDHIGMDLTTEIDRRDFGVAFNNELFDGQLNLGWNVVLDFALELSAPVEDDGSAG